MNINIRAQYFAPNFQIFKLFNFQIDLLSNFQINNLMNELTIKELIASGQKTIPFSEEVLQFLPKKYPALTIRRWKQRKEIPMTQFKKITVQDTEFAFLIHLKNLSRQGIRATHVFEAAGLSYLDYDKYFMQGIKIKPEITDALKNALAELKAKTLNALTAEDLSSLIKFYITKKLDLQPIYVTRILYFTKTGSISPDTLSVVLSALKQKAELL